jgi:CheY-like chemotaxis protein
MSVEPIRPTVLLVEDDPFLGDILGKNLEARGYRVDRAATLAQALAALAGAAPGRRVIDFDEAQARALCELVEDPSSGITRVTVVGAGPRLLEAIEDVAAARGVVLEEPRRTAGGSEAGSAD